MIYILMTYSQFRYFHRILPEWSWRKQLHLAHMQGLSIWRERHKWGAISFLVNQYRWRKMWAGRFRQHQEGPQ